MLKQLLTMFILTLMASGAFAQNVVNVTDADINGDVTWTANNTYVLDGFVFVEDGETLTIEPGTIIKGKPGQAENASALIVAQGGKIFANGTPGNPIVFTAEADNLNGNLPLDTRGLWGGVILLGKATINTATGVGQIEGIPSTEPRGAYGGNDDEDNSGVMRYVSIRYGGTDIGEGNEINGLTMAAVGSGTRIEYIEVFNNKDDGYEWFGGTVNCKYLVSAFNGDDAFDYDEGFRGYGQFWFAVQASDIGNRGAEQDGGTTPEDGMPYAMPQLYNVTYIGSGMNSINVDNDLAMIFRDNAGGKYFNSIFTDFAAGGIEVEDLASGEDSRARLEAGDLVLGNNLWWNFGNGSAITDIASQDFVQTMLTSNNNTIEDPMLNGISRTTDQGLDPRPGSGSPALNGAIAPPDDIFFTKVTYRGAFGPYDLWIDGWTATSQLGIVTVPQSEIVQVTDADISGDVTWTSNNTYILNGFVFVEDGESLTIQPGTVIKARPGQAENASALIVAQGGKIYANGTADNPIIFTAEADDVSSNNDLPLDTRGLWGGVILLGKSTINTATGVGQIEGIPSTEPRGAYGGDNDADNSGVMRYVSIRYGGTNIGEGNEINGLTMAAVGSGTTIEYIEVVNNADDGYEWFGGTVNTKHLISAFNGDDAFDYDEGFRGKGQFWFAVQAEDVGNRGAEQDGGTTPEDGMPYAMPTIYNATYIGSGMNSINLDNDLAMIFRDNAGGKYMNSIFTEFADMAIEVEDLASGEDSRARLEAGELLLSNNIWWNFGAGSSFDDIVSQDFVRTHLSSNNNQMVDPKLGSISRTNNAMLDPRPAADSPAMLSSELPPNDGFFSSVSYIGAFDATTNWMKGWSYLDAVNVLDVRERFDTRVPAAMELSQNYPNPFNPSTNFRFSLPQAGHVRLAVYNVYGQLVDVLVDDIREAGNYTLTWKADNLASGTYIYMMQSGGQVASRTMTLVK
ncbi:T9SS type A sorting domain-containing protein [bacterium]|nr:T9SS type A sorting domain-containing protein [bacterium]